MENRLQDDWQTIQMDGDAFRIVQCADYIQLTRESGPKTLPWEVFDCVSQ